MFEELKKELLIELKSELQKLKEDVDKTNLNIDNFYAMRLKLTANNILKDKRYIDFINHYSKISKFFNKQKFESEKRKLYNSIKEEYSKMALENEEKINDSRRVLNEINDKIIEITKRVNAVNNATKTEELGVSFKEVGDLFSKNNVDFSNYSLSEILKLGSNAMTTGNVSFMKKAIEEDPFNIMYDETNDFSLYYNFINNCNYDVQDNALSSENENKENFENNKKAILELLRQSQSGEIFIKPVHILEVIRFYIKDTVMYESGSIHKGNQDDLSKSFEFIKCVVQKALQLSESDYHKLESMYKREENDYYCHRTGRKNVEHEIFKNGLSISTQGIDPHRLIVRNARKVDCLLAIAGYENFYGGNGGGDDRIILEIPKNTVFPIGSDELSGKETYVLPNYVKASLHDTNLDGKVELHMNNCVDKKMYHYLYRDGYDMNNPFPVENPEYETSVEKAVKR